MTTAFLVTASQIGVTLGTIKPVTVGATVSAGLPFFSVIFPLASLSLLRGEHPVPRPSSVPKEMVL